MAEKQPVTAPVRRARLPWRLGALAPPEHCEDLSELGYDFLEIACGEFRMETADAEFDRLRERLAACEVPVEVCSMFLPRDIKLVGPKIDWQRFTDAAEVEVGRAAALGASVVLWANGPARTVPDGYPAEAAWDELVVAGRHLAGVARRHGVTIVFEPLKPSSTNLILTLAEGLEFVRRVDRPEVTVMADMFHMRENGESWRDIRALRGRLNYVHLCDHDRRAPGTTGQDADTYREVFATLAAIGYAGRVSIEASWTDVRPEASRAIDALERAVAETTG